MAAGRKPLEERIRKILTHTSPEEALIRLSGMEEHWYWSPEWRHQRALLSAAAGDLVKAGECWYLTDCMEAQATLCIAAFRKSCGNDPSVMLRRLVKHPFRSPAKYDAVAKQKMAGLIADVVQKQGFIPRFARTWNDHLRAFHASHNAGCAVSNDATGVLQNGQGRSVPS